MICRVLNISRSTFYYKPQKIVKRTVDKEIESAIYNLIQEKPTIGVRMVTARLRRKTGLNINHKKVYRIMKINNWQCSKRYRGLKPRVKSWKSRTTESNIRWAIDMTHIHTSSGLCHLTAVIDCCDRSILGWRLSSSSKASVAAGALEDAIIMNKITSKDKLVIRSDNGLIFGAKEFSSVVNSVKAHQEYITPYTPEQNGMIERFFRTLKEECIWLYNFKDQDHAFKEISEWIYDYNHDRPHSAIGYSTPKEFRLKLAS